MARETREQRQQRLLQSKQARQAREQEIIEGLPTLGAQAAWMGGLMAPSSGLTDYFGMYPQIPTEEQMIPTERLPSFSENIANKRYMDAMYQGLGLAGDFAIGAGAFYKPSLLLGAGLKMASAAGKASKAKGIASLQEKSDLAKAVKQKQKEAMERHANDYSDSVIGNPSGGLNYSSREIPFVSPTLEALIKRAPKNLKGKQVMEWVNANANKGVKPKEVEYLGIDEFIANNPNATVDEVIEGISENKISIQKSIYKTSDDSPVLEFIESKPDTDPLDGSNFWQYRTDDFLYDIERGDSEIQKELLDHYNEAWDVNKKSWDDVPEKMHEEIADSLARQEYRDNPYEMIEVANDLGQNPNNTFALGNEDIGYQIFVDGERYTAGRDVPYSNTEAKIQLRSAISDVGHDYVRLEGEVDDYGATQFKDYIDNNLPGGENYREVSFNWENAPKGHSYADHIEEDNQIAHALIRDRKLADGTDSLHIDELQSDLHTKGSKDGYKGPKTTKQINEIEEMNLILRDKIKNDFLNFYKVKDKYKLSGSDPAGARFDDDLAMFAQDHFPDISNRDIAKIAQRYGDQVKENFFESKGYALIGPKGADAVMPSEANDLLNELISSGIKLEKNTDQISQLQKAVPNYPFKDDWYNMGIKSLLMDAIEDGKDALSISTSAAMKNRYSDRYHKFYETLYDKKIPSAMQKLTKKYGGKFERGDLDLEDTFGYDPLGATTRRIDYAGEFGNISNRQINAIKNNTKANIIKITPEMREKILKEGLQTFASGGVIGNLPSRLAKI